MEYSRHGLSFISVVQSYKTQLPTLKIAAKRHVIQFLKKHLADPDDPAAPLKIPRKDLLLSIIKGNITDQAAQRATTTPAGFDTIRIRMPKQYQSFFVDQSAIDSLARALESYYWLNCNLFVLKSINQHSQHLDTAIKNFKKEFEITESIYPIGNMRRQINRSEIQGIQFNYPDTATRLSTRLSNAQVKEIARLHLNHKISLKQIATIYHIGKTTAHDLIKKYLQNQSDFRTNAERLTA